MQRERAEYRRNIGSDEDLAGYVGSVEGGLSFKALGGDVGVGTLSGCEDQTAMLCARPNALVQYSFCPVRFERLVPLPEGAAFVIASSGVVAAKTASAQEQYNRVSRKVRAVAEVWRETTGGTEPTLAAAIAARPSAAIELATSLERASAGGFSPRELSERLEHFLIESETIVPATSDALVLGDLESVGALVARSVDAAARLLGNQIPETLALTRLARDLGAVAASPFGAGFGGSVWALLEASGERRAAGAGRAEDAASFLETWRTRYLDEFPQRHAGSEFFLTRAGPPGAAF